MFSEFSEISWKPGLHSPIAKQVSEPMKRTAYNKGSLSFLFAFRGQFSQQFSHFHFSLILLYWPQYMISASPALAHRVWFSHCPPPGSFFLQPG